MATINLSQSNPLNEHDYCSPNKNSNSTVPKIMSVDKPEPTPTQTTEIQLREEEETREKRLRKEIHDPDFSHYTSSDYSSSDNESDQESEGDDEDDPSRAWCICNKPDDGLFMISCDVCKYWFHGHCVGMVEIQSKRLTREGKEWFCEDCTYALESGTARKDIPLRIGKKEKKKSSPKLTGKRRGRPRKSATPTRDTSARVSTRNAKKSNTSMDTRMSSRRSSTKSNIGSESFQEFENQARLKELIRERRKAFFLKHRLSEQLKEEKMKEHSFGRRSVTASLSDGLNSLVTNTISPNMNNLPINIKSEHKERNKPNIVLQINTKKDSGAESGSQRLVTTIVKKRKHSEANYKAADDLFTSNPIKVSKKTKKEVARIASPVTPSAKASASITPASDEEEVAANSQSSKSGSNKSSTNEQSSATKRKRKSSESNSNNGSSNGIEAKQMIKMIQDSLEQRCSKLKDMDVSTEKLGKLAADIQCQLNECYKEGTPKYLNKFRSLIFNLRDAKNEALLTNVLNGEIIPSRLVRMSHDDMASNELAKWRERENKHTIELIKRDAQLAAEQVIVKKTHKGEEVISAAQLNDSDSAAAAASDNQELSTTPTKTPAKQDTNNKLPSPVLGGRLTKSETREHHSKHPQAEANDPIDSKAETPVELSVLANNDPLSILNTTYDHKNHVFDIGCKICSKQQDDDGQDTKDAVAMAEPIVKRETGQEKSQDQPKRLRISIDSRLDPSNLSRLREPLIKPVEQPSDSKDSPSRASPNAAPTSDPESDAEPVGEDDDDLYDPETSTMPSGKTNELELPQVFDPDSRCWSGSITMKEAGTFSAYAKPISGNPDFIRNKIKPTLTVCGRIAPDQITSYIKQIKSTAKHQILLVQLHPMTENDKSSYETFFDYLYTRNRCCVISCGAHSNLLKDFYILPVHEKSNIPEILRPIDGRELDRTLPNCLLGLLVKTRRSPSASGSSSYTPTPID